MFTCFFLLIFNVVIRILYITLCGSDCLYNGYTGLEASKELGVEEGSFLQKFLWNFFNSNCNVLKNIMWPLTVRI